ncbi:MAG: hypothetical protein CMK92_05890 [Pseudomonas sp.]|nr:hypothetical protein [Pseudomonas sp.]
MDEDWRRFLSDEHQQESTPQPSPNSAAAADSTQIVEQPYATTVTNNYTDRESKETGGTAISQSTVTEISINFRWGEISDDGRFITVIDSRTKIPHMIVADRISFKLLETCPTVELRTAAARFTYEALSVISDNKSWLSTVDFFSETLNSADDPRFSDVIDVVSSHRRFIYVVFIRNWVIDKVFKNKEAKYTYSDLGKMCVILGFINNKHKSPLIAADDLNKNFRDVVFKAYLGLLTRKLPVIYGWNQTELIIENRSHAGDNMFEMSDAHFIKMYPYSSKHIEMRVFEAVAAVRTELCTNMNSVKAWDVFARYNLPAGYAKYHNIVLQLIKFHKVVKINICLNFIEIYNVGVASGFIEE